MKTAKQLVKEFWFPLLVAGAWSSYYFFYLPYGERSIRNLINYFGPSFFFISWLVAQWYRVKKQRYVEEGLLEIETKATQMLTKIEERTNNLV